MKKLLIIIILGGLAYGAYWYMGEVQKKTSDSQGVTKKSEKALKEMDGQDINVK